MSTDRRSKLKEEDNYEKVVRPEIYIITGLMMSWDDITVNGHVFVLESCSQKRGI